LDSAMKIINAHTKAKAAKDKLAPRGAGAADEARNQRQGIKGKPDAENLPSFAYAWQQLNPGREDDAQNANTSIWDKHFAATRSSNVRQIFYSTNNQQLKAIFHPRKVRNKMTEYRYLYFNVPFQVFNRLEYMERSGGSVGAEFWKLMRIKPKAHRYNYRRLFTGKDGEWQAKGVLHKHGMPDIDDAPIYAEHTEARLADARRRNEERLTREFGLRPSGRADAGSARQRGAGKGSARARKQR